jgi:predicted dehydrogenase
MDKDKLGIGVIGLFMGNNALKVNEMKSFHSEVRGICDINPQRLEERQREYNIPFATDTYQKLIDRKDIDIIGIFSPDHLHMSMIRDALTAGKHVICTKPMVTNIHDAKVVMELVRKTGKKFLVGQTRRYEKVHQEAKALYDEGKIGRPLFAEASYVHGDFWKVLDRGSWRYEVPQDMIYGGGCHPIDHLRWYFGDVEEVFCYSAPSPVDLRYPQTHDLNYLINLRFANGVMARVMNAMGVVEPPYGGISDIFPGEGFSVFGTNGTIANYHARYFENGDHSKPVTIDFPRTEVMEDFDGKEYTGHAASVLKYIQEMEDCIFQDHTPLVDEIEGAKVIATCSACAESSKTGLPIKVDNKLLL